MQVSFWLRCLVLTVLGVMVDWFSVCEIEMEWYDGPEERKEKNYGFI